MKKENWIWMPHPGHFICSDSCKFHLNTYVGKYIVSTVGEYIPDLAVLEILYPELNEFKGDKKREVYCKKYFCEELGLDRKYETMVFKAAKSANACCPYRQVSGEDVDFAGYNSSVEAFKGHMKLCKKWSRPCHK